MLGYFKHSGGPLVVYEENRWILLGVVSYVSGVMDKEEIKCDPTGPSFYTKVSSYIAWIKSNI